MTFDLMYGVWELPSWKSLLVDFLIPSNFFNLLFIKKALNHFQNSKWASVFEQLYQVVQGPAPQLVSGSNGLDFSDDFCNFVNTW